MSGGDGWVPGTVIDVSKWQATLPSLTGVLGVIARAGIGTKPDAMFTTHIANARKAGKWVGSYWYNWGDLSVSQQVDAYIAREKEVGGVQLHVIDWEGAEGFTADQTADFIIMYRDRTGHDIGLYASEGRFRDLGQDFNWIANYSQEPRKAYDMWQYGPFRGVDGNHARQRIIDLAKGADMATGIPLIDHAPAAGFARVKAGLVGVQAVQIADQEHFDVPAGQGKPVLQTARIDPKFNWNPGAEVRVIGGPGIEGAIFLRNQVDFDPAPDDTPYSKADIDKATADAKLAQKANDQAAIDAANAAAAKATADLAAAPVKERERIATASGAAEANRIRTI